LLPPLNPELGGLAGALGTTAGDALALLDVELLVDEEEADDAEGARQISESSPYLAKMASSMTAGWLGPSR
jgi:hypothetical protein